MEVDEERVRLEKLAEELIDCPENDAQVKLQLWIHLILFISHSTATQLLTLVSV